ncbi:MAG: hypothetical protein HY049_17480 [Acidobacteria bacterium]|nr:hypothetical protein [Acidobacteriota bacterium]
MRPFLPPDTGGILERIAARNAKRLRRLSAALRDVAGAAPRRQALDALDAVLASTRGDGRREFLLDPELRAWLAATEEAIALARPETGTGDLALFERVSRGPHLRDLVPRGGLDRGFRGRVRRLGELGLARAFAEIPVLLAFRTPEGSTFGPFLLDASASGEAARAEGEVHFSHPAPLTISRHGALEIALVPGGVRLGPGRGRPRVFPRASIGDSGILLARRVASTRRGLRAGSHAPGIARDLRAALSLLRSAWPGAHAEVLAHTKIVVPLRERNTVSFSLPDRPGVSYINVEGKSLVDLADDLLHETAHHRLHALEEIEGPLDCDDGEPRYVSPWRRGVRPLHGILHATYTFAWRAELLRRLLRLAAARAGRTGAAIPLDRRWLRRELIWEITSLRQSLADLEDAGTRGLLTAAGLRVRDAVARRVAGMERDSSARPLTAPHRRMGSTPGGSR